MEQKIKEIVATFVKVPVENIGPATRIDRSAVQSSILLHRMYASLAEAGLVVRDYSAIKVFDDLMASHSAEGDSEVQDNVFVTGRLESAVSELRGLQGIEMAPGVGVDIEEIAALPRASDHRKEEFYKMNFTAVEISYCILQPDPYASFAGLFAAKEAIIKAGGGDRSRSFNLLEIDHTPEGRPLYPGYGISISHAGGMAVAVAVATSSVVAELTASAGPSLNEVPPAKKGSGSWISWLALLISVLALMLVLLH